jgi:hypothetical protein
MNGFPSGRYRRLDETDAERASELLRSLGQPPEPVVVLQQGEVALSARSDRRTNGGHLRDPLNLAELALQRSGDRSGHGFATTRRSSLARSVPEVLCIETEEINT